MPIVILQKQTLSKRPVIIHNSQTDVNIPMCIFSQLPKKRCRCIMLMNRIVAEPKGLTAG